MTRPVRGMQSGGCHFGNGKRVVSQYAGQDAMEEAMVLQLLELLQQSCK
jgi:hypothetical protein